MENSNIEWTHHTFNAWIGCTKVSPGCTHCYAETLMDTRYGRVKWGPGQTRSRTSAANWNKPRQWNRAAEGAAERPRVFCASLADWLDGEVPLQWLAELMDLIRETPNLDWLLLTKRSQNFDRLGDAMIYADQDTRYWLADWSGGEAPHNVWVGTTVEDQQRADERIPLLLGIPAKVRFLSCEPLLESINLKSSIGNQQSAIHWIICGGESGPGARPMDPMWARSLRDQCQAGEAAFLFKQWGGTNKKSTGRILDGRTWDEIPNITNQ